MLEEEFRNLIEKIQHRKCEEQTLEVKAASKGCPERLYDTFSSFSNQNEGGIIVFGLDEKQGFAKVGVYDAQDLQRKLMEVGEAMTPVVRPVLSVYAEGTMLFVAADIPPLDLTERPCFKTARGRLKGSFIRVGDADKPMTEYEVYSYEAYRKRSRDDLRPVESISDTALDQVQLEQYLLKRKLERPNFASMPSEQLYELTGLKKDGQLTLTAVLLFSLYPQAYFPQLSIIASRVPGTEMGELDETGQRFLDSKRMEGNLPEMLEGAVSFLRNNMRIALRIDKETGKRQDIPEYPMDALREAVLNALLHRDYSIHTENMPIQLIMFHDRVEIRNPGGLYGRLTVDQLGKMQPDTRNPAIVTAMESLGQTENRYSGIPRIRRAMAEAGLPEPIFQDDRREFSVCLYNRESARAESTQTSSLAVPCKMGTINDHGLLEFCKIPRTRKEIVKFLGIASGQYAIRRYLEPLVQSGAILMMIPERPKSPKQTYQTDPHVLGNIV